MASNNSLDNSTIQKIWDTFDTENPYQSASKEVDDDEQVMIVHLPDNYHVKVKKNASADWIEVPHVLDEPKGD